MGLGLPSHGEALELCGIATADHRCPNLAADPRTGTIFQELRRHKKSTTPQDRRVTKHPPLTEAMLSKSIISGSVRARRELFKAKLVDSPKCTCQDCAEALHDKEHLFWHCKEWDHIRKPFVMELEAVAEKPSRWSGWARSKLDSFLATPCLRQCGIIPWDSEPDELVKNIPRFETLNATPWDWSVVTEDQRQGERHNQDRLGVFTDGSSLNPDFPTLQRGGWGSSLEETTR